MSSLNFSHQAIADFVGCVNANVTHPHIDDFRFAFARIQHRSFRQEESRSMPIVVTLSSELEALLREYAVRRGQDVNLVARILLASV